MDRGAWWAAVHGVAKSQRRLSDFTFTHWRKKWQPTPVFLPGESQGRGSLVGCCLWGRMQKPRDLIKQKNYPGNSVNWKQILTHPNTYWIFTMISSTKYLCKNLELTRNSHICSLSLISLSTTTYEWKDNYYILKDIGNNFNEVIWLAYSHKVS